MHLEKPSLAKRIQDPTNRGYDVLNKIFFTASPSSQAAGEAFIRRLSQRKDDLDPVSGPKVAGAQIAAFREWEQFKGERFVELRGIRQPALIVNGVGAVPTRIILRKIDARSCTIWSATIPPSEYPSTSHLSIPSASRKAMGCRAMATTVGGTSPPERPRPALSYRMTSRPAASGSVTAGSQLSSVPVKCCRKSNGRPGPLPKRRYA
jgi:hypothetical protein